MTEIKPPFGYQVLFDGYGNSEEVPFEYLRPLTQTPPTATSSDATASQTRLNKSASATTTATAAAAAATAESKLIKIPENLQILPTDTEAEKERKRKRIKAIKSLNRHRQYEIERNTKQQGWKSFQSKAVKKKVKGASGVLLKRGSSIFASPDTVNGRVGVVGSGQGMTEFQDTRKKYKVTGPSDAS